MEYVYIGEVTNTHGLKGEIRIISDFRHKEKIFIKDFVLYLGECKQSQVITSYRPHKHYHMVMFEGIDNINDAIAFKGDSVYIKRSDIDGYYLNEDLIGLEVIASGKSKGIVDDVMKSVAHDLLIVGNNKIPLVDEFIKKIDLENKKIEINEIEGLFNED